MIKVKDLIESLKKCDPEAVVCISEKWGRGGQPNPGCLEEGTLGEFGYVERDEDEGLPAIELSCGY